MGRLYIGCIETHAYCRQVTSLVCLSEVIWDPFLNINDVFNSEQEKIFIIRVRMG